MLNEMKHFQLEASWLEVLCNATNDEIPKCLSF